MNSSAMSSTHKKDSNDYSINQPSVNARTRSCLDAESLHNNTFYNTISLSKPITTTLKGEQVLVEHDDSAMSKRSSIADIIKFIIPYKQQIKVQPRNNLRLNTQK